MGGLSSFLWRGISEYLLVKQDIKRFRGKKNVIAVMAIDRNHPEFKRAERYFARIGSEGDVAFVTEDHPDGPLHTRFQCDDQAFCFALVDKQGKVLAQEDHTLTLNVVRDLLHLNQPERAIY